MTFYLFTYDFHFQIFRLTVLVLTSSKHLSADDYAFMTTYTASVLVLNTDPPSHLARNTTFKSRTIMIKYKIVHYLIYINEHHNVCSIWWLQSITCILQTLHAIPFHKIAWLSSLTKLMLVTVT